MTALFSASDHSKPLLINGSGQKSLLSALMSRVNSSWMLMAVLFLALGVIDTFVYPGTSWGNRDSFGGCNFKNKFLAYAREAVLPFYILHQTVIITVGFYVIRWKLSPAVKYLITVPVSFILIIALYDLLIRRINKKNKRPPLSLRYESYPQTWLNIQRLRVKP